MPAGTGEAMQILETGRQSSLTSCSPTARLISHARQQLLLLPSERIKQCQASVQRCIVGVHPSNPYTSWVLVFFEGVLLELCSPEPDILPSILQIDDLNEAPCKKTFGPELCLASRQGQTALPPTSLQVLQGLALKLRVFGATRSSLG